MINTDKLKELLVIIENIDKLKLKLKNISEKKKNIEKILLKSMEDNSLVDTRVETNNYCIDYVKQKSYQSISKTYLEEKLNIYFKDKDINIDELIKFLYNSREIKETKSLKIKLKSNS